MSSTLGEKLRQAREERGISISEVAEQTRISPQYLHSIENDDYKPLPGGIFNKGFLKSFARYVGYNEHDALQEYSQLVAITEKSDEEEFKSYRPEVLTDERAAASPLPTIIFAGVILTLMTLGILYLVRYIINQPSPATEVVSNTNNNPVQPATIESVQPVSGAAPTMETLSVEFKTSSSPISLSSISDGKSSIALITPDKLARFEPRHNLRLAYARALSSAAQLTVNGKSIALPENPGNPKRAAIEIELSNENLASVWQNARVEPLGVSVSPAATPRAPARPARVANTAAARPANTAGTANRTP